MIELIIISDNIDINLYNLEKFPQIITNSLMIILLGFES